MIKRLSDVFNISHEALEEKGVFDAFLDIDSQFHIDPHLLESSSIPEMKDAYSHFTKHFEEVIHILSASKNKTDIFFRSAVVKLTFHEIHQLGLGYSHKGTKGSAIGAGIADQLASTAKLIIDAGIKDPVLFELIGLIEEGIGADRVSDMVAAVILPFILSYTQRIAKELSLPTIVNTYRGQQYQVPRDPETMRIRLFLAKEILRPLPIAHDWSEIDTVCSHNHALRDRVNYIIGDTWKQATSKAKHELRSVLLSQPDVLSDLISQYKAKPADQYDFISDPEGEIKWYTAAKDFTQSHPLDLSAYKGLSIRNAYEAVKTICSRYKQLIENNGLVQLLYNDTGKLKHERAAQLLFFGIADAYCEANNLDLSREPNGGRGPVDFKLSRGFDIKINVEVKYSSNPKLVNGFRDQLPAYNQAEGADKSIYLILKTTYSSTKIDEIIELRDQLVSKGQKVPDIVVIDCNQKPSASKL